MNRRAFVTGLGAVLAAPFGVGAQQPRNRPIIGYLSGSTPSVTAAVRAAFLRGLRDLGWIEGDNITIESRWASGNAEALGRLAAELVQLDVSVIVAGGTTVIRAAKNATSTIPIVMAGGGDPVGSGLVASLAHPGGNITGISLFGGGAPRQVPFAAPRSCAASQADRRAVQCREPRERLLPQGTGDDGPIARSRARCSESAKRRRCRARFGTHAGGRVTRHRRSNVCHAPEGLGRFGSEEA